MSAHKNFFHTSDFILYCVVLISAIMEFLFPTELPMNSALSRAIGIIFLAVSWTLIFVTKYQFKRHDQRTGPKSETTQIIKTGMLSYTRNPIYLGVVLLPPALGFIANSVWLILAIIPTISLIQALLIIPEEKYLKAKFGNEYADYMNNVRRWI